jgi:hypothetical protein
MTTDKFAPTLANASTSPALASSVLPLAAKNSVHAGGVGSHQIYRIASLARSSAYASRRTLA